jgi:hypothetical protein
VDAEILRDLRDRPTGLEHKAQPRAP